MSMTISIMNFIREITIKFKNKIDMFDGTSIKSEEERLWHNNNFFEIFGKKNKKKSIGDVVMFPCF